MGCGPRKYSTSSKTLACPTCCEKYVPPGRRTRAISSHHTVAGCLLVTRSKAPSANGSGDSSASATTTAPSGCSSAVAFATFGGHDSVATITGGIVTGGIVIAPARTSPPPVWMSRAAFARETFTHQALIPPRRPLFGGPAVQPGEIPAVHRYGFRLGHQLLECACHAGKPDRKSRIDRADYRGSTGPSSMLIQA
nr:hypothetical protein JVH1_3105 [Rhodococcus sp. JVH1]